ncbi:hypothetical protein BCR42DRAFT_402826 [Absidia repens]|uniref:Uncharacterized protein n=1 Tax=Absidia repens TaxID=90262 RepID=A0A1X2IYL5_9FUNG|nr:hypothetical protein BCR42DRAFT_402826 [Absidia repens]
MDVGQRPSRQRRHLPNNVTALQYHESSTTAASTKQQDDAANSDDHDYNNDNDNEYYSRQRGRGRKLLAKKRMQQSFGNLVTSSKKGAMTDESVWLSIQWRVWFWRLCVLWLAFLTLRVLTSIWQGDTTRLGLTQYLSHLPSTWW